MAEEQTTETAPVETTTEATETVETAVDTSAETENTGAAAPTTTQGPIPYARFKEVNDERKALKARLEELERKAAEAEPEPAPEPQPQAPPEEFSAQQKLDWYIQRGAEKLLKDKLGMSLDQVRTLLSVNQELGNDYAERRWSAVCSGIGADPKNVQLRESTANLVRKGYAPEDAAELSAMRLKMGRYADKPAPQPKTANVEDGGVTGVMTQERWLPRDKHEAAAAAAKGKRAPHLTAEEIFKARKSG